MMDNNDNMKRCDQKLKQTVKNRAGKSGYDTLLDKIQQNNPLLKMTGWLETKLCTFSDLFLSAIVLITPQVLLAQRTRCSCEWQKSIMPGGDERDREIAISHKSLSTKSSVK
jgi:hypothetical protein